jgi:hypothetical protein
MSTAIHELEVADVPRSAVIACYRRCEAALALHRRGRGASETPREVELAVTSGDRSVALSALEEI